LVPYRFLPQWLGWDLGHLLVAARAAGIPLAHVVAFGVGGDASVITGFFFEIDFISGGLRQAMEGRLLEVKAKDWTMTSMNAASFLESSSSFVFS
jgi:hypothetical protein